MYRVVLLTFDEGCSHPRAAALACRDALRNRGAQVDLVTASAEADIDAAIGAVSAAGDPPGDGPPEDGPPEDGPDSARLVVAVATDAQLRAVLRRMVARYAPAPGRRPADLPADRTVPDLPPIGVLPVAEGGAPIVDRLGLPVTADAVADAVLADRVRRFDLLRNDHSSVTVDGALIGGADADGRALPFRATIHVDDAELSNGHEPLLAVVVANADGYATVDGLPLVIDTRADDGRVDVGVAVPVHHRGRVEVEVRRARGRAVALTVGNDDVPFLDDGVTGSLRRRRTWWIEKAAWAVFTTE